MTSRDTVDRIERMILECGQLGIKPTPEAIAALQDAQGAYGEYREAVTRILIGR